MYGWVQFTMIVQWYTVYPGHGHEYVWVRTLYYDSPMVMVMNMYGWVQFTMIVQWYTVYPGNGHEYAWVSTI